MEHATTILSQCLNAPTARLAATKPEECLVGPDADERIERAPSWGSSRKRKLDSSSFQHGVETFLESGCCVIPNVLPPDFVKSCKDKAHADLCLLEQQLADRKRHAIATCNSHLLAAVSNVNFSEIVDRDGGRRDVRYQLDQFPYTASGLVYNSIVYPLVHELLGGGDGVTLLYAGVMWAEGGESSSPQKWHGDGGHLFHHTHLPPHCINVFFPLVDLNDDNGPTEFQPGTHKLEQFDNTAATSFPLTCQAGGAILFDYRVKHRGGAVVGKHSRPVLYLAYAKPFFRDAGNNRSGNSLLGGAASVWTARILTGRAVSMGEGFVQDESDKQKEESRDSTTANRATNDTGSNGASENVAAAAATTGNSNNAGSGERWILFRMNVELPDREEPTVLTVYHGDIASETAAQFCLEHELDKAFGPILADTIQQQIDNAAASLQSSY